MKLGVDHFLASYLHLVEGKRVGLVTNITGVNEQLQSTLDLFHAHPAIHLTALYAPEHGIRGDVHAGEKIQSFIDDVTGLPVHSLYGETRKPTQEMLKNIDIMVFDLQDLGARYYTYIYTLAYVMEACGELNIPVIVLDRPNPVGGDVVEGNRNEEKFRSFVGLYALPVRHGMTVGELAQWFVGEEGVQCDLTVVPLDGWKRHMYFDDTPFYWVPPSPNSTNINMCILYGGTCLFEGTNVSEGRGTPQPFEMIGAPFINNRELAHTFNNLQLPGVFARPTSFLPTASKHANEQCFGVQLHITDRYQIRPFETGIQLLRCIAKLYPNDFIFNENGLGIENGNNVSFFFDLIAGSDQLREGILKDNVEPFIENAKAEAAQFKNQRAKYLLYI